MWVIAERLWDEHKGYYYLDKIAASAKVNNGPFQDFINNIIDNNLFSPNEMVTKLMGGLMLTEQKVFKTDLWYGKTDDKVGELQKYLTELGYYMGEIDNYYGDEVYIKGTHKDGIYTIHDCMHRRKTSQIDFLDAGISISSPLTDLDGNTRVVDDPVTADTGEIRSQYFRRNIE